MIVGLALFIGSCIMELVVSCVGNITLVVTPVGSVVVSIVVAISENLFKPGEGDEMPAEGDDSFTRLGMGLRNIKNGVRNNTKLFALFIGVVYLLGCTALAANHTGGRVVNTVVNGAVNVIDKLTSYGEPAADPVDPSDPVDTPDVPPQSSSPPEASAPDTPETQPSDAEYVTLLEPNRIKRLSDSERRELYYFAGENAVSEEKDDKEIYSAVSARVAALVENKQEDKFNQTPEGDKNRKDANDASWDEKEMKTSKDLDDIIGKRKTVYEDAPGAEIAKLIAENYNGYSLAYHSIGSETTAEYYWNESLRWYHECLTFQSSPEFISDILHRIGTRYQDLASLKAFGSDEQMRATALSEAYNSLSESYGQSS